MTSEIPSPNDECRRPVIVICLAAICALWAVVLYLPMLRADFVWDARAQVLTDDFIHTPANMWDVLSLRVLGRDVLDNNRPINLLTLMLDSALWGKNPAGYHLTNVLWHAGTVVLLFLFCASFTSRAWAFCVALIYAAHPINCEAVAEVSYREDLLAAFFVLAGLNLATLFKPERSGKALFTGCASAFCFFVAISAKENAIAGPMALALYWWLFRRDENRVGWLLLIAASGAAVGAFLAARFLLQPKVSVIFTEPPHRLGLTLIDTLLIQPRIWVCYLSKIVLPQGFCADYGADSIRNFPLATSLAVLTIVGIAKVLASFCNRSFALGAAIFWLSLLPVSNLIPIFRPMADRFLYLPMTGVALMLGAIPFKRPVLVPIGIAVALVLSVLTFQREKDWRDSIAIWTDTVQKNPRSSDAATNLGGALFDAGRLTESVASYERAIQLSGGKAGGAFAEMAVALDALGKTVEADAAYKRAIALNDRFAHPDLLVKGLTWEKRNADKLQTIADRN